MRGARPRDALGPPDRRWPAANALRIYRNYDGAGAKYGDTWVRSTSSDQARVSMCLSLRTSDGALTIMVVNKSAAAQSATLIVVAKKS